jgi:glyoxylase-like metal-dependent hydrolase (beta-lactamase superfamily II)
MSARVLACVLLSGFAGAAAAQDAKSVIENASKAIGASGLRTIEYSGSGSHFALGQNAHPRLPWPRFHVKTYLRAIDYQTPAGREEMLRTQGENPVRGGGGQPMLGEQRLVLMVSGGRAWNMTGNNATPAPATAADRLLQIWTTPHGFLQAAMTSNATARRQMLAGRTVTVVSFLGHGKHRINGTINEQNLVERVETWSDSPVMGDMHIENAYSGYQDFGGIKFPTRILQRGGGHPILDITVTAVRPNAPVVITVPENIRSATPAPMRVEKEQLAEGVWRLTGGSHHSVAVEFQDYVAVVEAPLNEERSQAVIDEVKKTIPGKPIRYVINTHHHFDHSGGLRTYAAEGATIVTHPSNVPFYKLAWLAPRTLHPDRLLRERKPARFLEVRNRQVLRDGSRVLEIHRIQGSQHSDGMLMVYLPKEKLLIEVDVFTPGPPGAPPPAVPNVFSVNLYENLQRLKLEVDRIAALHGRVTTAAELAKAIGK